MMMKLTCRIPFIDGFDVPPVVTADDDAEEDEELEEPASGVKSITSVSVPSYKTSALLMARMRSPRV